MPTYSTQELQSFFQTWNQVSLSVTRLTIAFSRATDALTRLSEAITPEMRLAIQVYEFELSLSRIAACETFTAWGLPMLVAQWLTQRLPESVVLHFAEMINQ